MIEPSNELTFREREIAALVAAGLSNKEIARQLYLSVSTVKAHVHALLKKLSIASRRDVSRRLADIDATKEI